MYTYSLEQCFDNFFFEMQVAAKGLTAYVEYVRTVLEPELEDLKQLNHNHVQKCTGIAQY